MIERSFRISETDYMQLKEIAKSEKLPVSYLVRLAIANFVDSYCEVVLDVREKH